MTPQPIHNMVMMTCSQQWHTACAGPCESISPVASRSARHGPDAGAASTRRRGTAHTVEVTGSRADSLTGSGI